MLKTIITTIDDLDGQPADETVPFTYDGVAYTIDLTAKNAAKLRAALNPYTNAGNRVSGRRVTTGVTHRARQEATDHRNKIREWARQNGYKVADRGSIADHIVTKYQQAHRNPGRGSKR